MSKITVILGAQWGDEGKGKLVDLFATKADLVCRFNGGNNAGHTVVVSESGVEYDFHLLPSGILNADCLSIIGNGCVIHLPDLVKEINKKEVGAGGSLLTNWQDRLVISDRAHLVFDFHQEIDLLVEELKGNECIGTTRKGIGPAYSSKTTRNGIRVGDLVYDFEGSFCKKFKDLVRFMQATYQNMSHINIEKELKKYEILSDFFKPCVRDTVSLLNNILRNESNKSIVAEGAQAALLDIDFGKILEFLFFMFIYNNYSSRF